MAGTSRDAPVIYYIPKSVTRTTIFLKIYIVICTTFSVKLYFHSAILSLTSFAFANSAAARMAFSSRSSFKYFFSIDSLL